MLHPAQLFIVHSVKHVSYKYVLIFDYTFIELILNVLFIHR
jgi:hypothetical protein